MDKDKISVYACELIHLPKISERSGNITPIENSKEIPFDVNRVFYLYDIPGGESRGAHAHKECHQFLVSASGSFEVLLDDGKIKRQILLNRPDIGLHIPPGIWASEINFSSGSICLVLASHNYTESDYIRDYQEFLDYKLGNSDVSFVDYNEDVLEKSWKWLNDPEIKVLTNTPDFTRESQHFWFKQLSTNETYFVKGVTYFGALIGVAGLKRIDILNGDAEYFGYIGEKKFWNKGLGQKILRLIQNYAKNVLKLKSIYLNVSSENLRAIKAYHKFGYKTEFTDEINKMIKMRLFL